MGRHDQKWVEPVWSWDPKIDYISRMNRWNELIFFNAGANSEKLKVISVIVEWALSKNGHNHLVHETLKSACL